MIDYHLKTVIFSAESLLIKWNLLVRLFNYRFLKFLGSSENKTIQNKCKVTYVICKNMTI